MMTFAVLCPDVVDDDVVGTLKGAAGEKGERFKSVERLVVDAPEDFDRVSHGKVGDGRRGHRNVRQGGKKRSQLDRHGSAAHAVHEAGVRGADDEVGANAIGALFLVVEHAHEDGDYGQNHDHFNGDSEHADDGAYGTANEIGNDELVHARALFRGARLVNCPSYSGYQQE